MPVNKPNVLKGREVVDTYREAHHALHLKPWHKGIPEAHTPLLEKMLAGLNKQDFNSLDEFFTANEELNIQQLGFASKGDFEARAEDSDQEALRSKWS